MSNSKAFWQSPGGAAAIGAIGSAGSGLFGGLFSIGSQKRQYKYNLRLQQQQQDWQRMMWDLQNQYNLPVNEVKRLLDAGINPASAFGNSGGAAAPVPHSGSAGGVSAPTASMPNIGAFAVQASQAQQRLDNETKVADSTADKNEAEAEAARASAGLSNEQASYIKLNAELLESTKEVIKNHKELSYRFDLLLYALGENKKVRDDIYTASFATENSLRLEHMRLDNRKLEREYDLLQKQIDLYVATKQLTEQQAREVSLRADMLFYDRYFAEWSYNYSREFNKAVYGSADKVHAGSAAFQNVISVAKKNIANAVVRANLNEKTLNNDYGFEVDYGADYRFYQFEDLRRGANLKRVHQYTDVISSIAQAASMAVSAGSSAVFRREIIKSMHRTNRSFGFPGYAIQPGHEFDL